MANRGWNKHGTLILATLILVSLGINVLMTFYREKPDDRQIFGIHLPEFQLVTNDNLD